MLWFSCPQTPALPTPRGQPPAPRHCQIPQRMQRKPCSGCKQNPLQFGTDVSVSSLKTEKQRRHQWNAGLGLALLLPALGAGLELAAGRSLSSTPSTQPNFAERFFLFKNREKALPDGKRQLQFTAHFQQQSRYAPSGPVFNRDDKPALLPARALDRRPSAAPSAAACRCWAVAAAAPA